MSAFGFPAQVTATLDNRTSMLRPVVQNYAIGRDDTVSAIATGSVDYFYTTSAQTRCA